MNRNQTLGLLVLGALTAIVSCDGASSGTSAGLGADDCPFGTFRPMGLAQCVFPADDVNNQPIGVSDNRCAVGQPAIPPSCVSESGGRAYLSTTSDCAPGYRFLEGACNRNGGTGGFFGVGPAGTGGVAGGFGTASGAAGFVPGDSQGVAGSTFTGAAGSPAGTGSAGAGGDAGGTGGSGGTG